MTKKNARRSNGKDRRKNIRNANNSIEQPATTSQQSTGDQKNENFEKEEEQDGDIDIYEAEADDHDQEQKYISCSLTQTTNQTEKYLDSVPQIEQNDSLPTNFKQYQRTSSSMKHKHQTKANQYNNTSSIASSAEEATTGPSKPQVSVTPAKQMSSPTRPASFNNNQTFDSNNSDAYSWRNGHQSFYKNYSYQNQNTLPPRFQRQRQEAVEANDHQSYQRRRPPPFSFKRSSFYSSQTRHQNNHHSPSPQPEQHQRDDHVHERSQSPMRFLQNSQQPISNDYSSESENLSDVPSATENTSNSPLLSTSACSQSSLRGMDIIRSLPTSNEILSKLISIFDTVTFSPDEFELLLSKIATKHILNKPEIQRLVKPTKSDPSLERILDETYLSQVKILAVELQTEKSRVLELTKLNTDMDHTIRQLQQQQPQTLSIGQYQHMILSYQTQIRRYADENARLQYQLSAYSMMPATMNELKQQHEILTEQLRQMKIRNNALENEAAESERASKHAAEIYKKADAQKQERIEKMISDINKYKKLDKELTSDRQKCQELEGTFQTKIDEITQERDDLRVELERLAEMIEKYQDLQTKYDNLLQNQSNISVEDLTKELEDLKVKNNQLRHENWKVVEEINRLSHENK